MIDGSSPDGRMSALRGHYGLRGPPVGVSASNLWIGVLVGLLVVQGCDGENGRRDPVPEIFAGTRVERTDRSDRIEGDFEAAFTLRDSSSDPLLFASVNREDIDVGDSGQIFVLSALEHRVYVFGRSGSLRHRWGREGGGPGEMEHPTALSVAPDGTIHIYDAGHRRIFRFDAEGEFLSSDDAGVAVRRFAHTERRLALQIEENLRSDERRREELLYVAGRDTSEIAVLTYPLGFVRPRSCPLRLWLPPVFHPTLRWASSGERIAVVKSSSYTVGVLDHGAPRFVLRRTLEPPEASRTRAAKRMGEALVVRLPSGARIRCDVGEVLDQRGVADEIPLVTDVAVSPAGDVWVEYRTQDGGASRVDIFDHRGEYRKTLPSGAPFPTAFLSADAFLDLRNVEGSGGSVVTGYSVGAR